MKDVDDKDESAHEANTPVLQEEISTEPVLEDTELHTPDGCNVDTFTPSTIAEMLTPILNSPKSASFKHKSINAYNLPPPPIRLRSPSSKSKFEDVMRCVSWGYELLPGCANSRDIDMDLSTARAIDETVIKCRFKEDLPIASSFEFVDDVKQEIISLNQLCYLRYVCNSRQQELIADAISKKTTYINGVLTKSYVGNLIDTLVATLGRLESPRMLGTMCLSDIFVVSELLSNRDLAVPDLISVLKHVIKLTMIYPSNRYVQSALSMFVSLCYTVHVEIQPLLARELCMLDMSKLENIKMTDGDFMKAIYQFLPSECELALGVPRCLLDLLRMLIVTKTLDISGNACFPDLETLLGYPQSETMCEVLVYDLIGHWLTHQPLSPDCCFDAYIAETTFYSDIYKAALFTLLCLCDVMDDEQTIQKLLLCSSDNALAWALITLLSTKKKFTTSVPERLLARLTQRAMNANNVQQLLNAINDSTARTQRDVLNTMYLQAPLVPSTVISVDNIKHLLAVMG